MAINKNPFEKVPENTDLATESLINTYSIETQNNRLYEHLQAGNTINFLQARDLGIGFPNSRIAELRKQQVTIYSRFIRISNVQCKEYSLQPFV